MSKIFTSNFTSILDEIGCDGYGVDVDAVYEALRRNDPLSDAPEIMQINRLYERNVAGPFAKPGGIIEVLFQALRDGGCSKFSAYTWLLPYRWVDTHANLVLNRLYGSDCPLLDNFLLLNDGAFDDLIKRVFGGAEHPDADKDYPIALLVAEEKKGSELTEIEIANIRAKFYKRTPEELDELKQQFIREIKDEWERFSNLTTDDILKWR